MTVSPLHVSGTLELDGDETLAGDEITLPSDGIWAIEFVSAWISAPAGDRLHPFEVWTSAPTVPSGTSRPHHYFQPVPLPGSTTGSVVSQPTRLYATAGSQVRVQLRRNSGSGKATARYTLSGQVLA